MPGPVAIASSVGLHQPVGPVRSIWYHAYVVIDIFIRHIVDPRGARRIRAEELISETVLRPRVDRRIHPAYYDQEHRRSGLDGYPPASVHFDVRRGS